MKIASYPNPNELAQRYQKHLQNRTKSPDPYCNGISQVVKNLAVELEGLGFSYVDNSASADLVVRHAGADGGDRCDITHCHGLLPTAMKPLDKWAWEVNRQVIDNIMLASATTVPSEWVADIIRRDMRFSPTVTNWGIHADEFDPMQLHKNFVLWAKGRPGDVCSPEPMNKLASMIPSQQFMTTFGVATENVQVIGLQPFDNMKTILARAEVYLATTRETFGIQTLEAMACGVPVLAWDNSAHPDIVKHKHNGYLAQPGNYEDLLTGLDFCKTNREYLSLNALATAHEFTWFRCAKIIAELYHQIATRPNPSVQVSFIIPCYNYEHWVADAITSVLAQDTSTSFEVIVVNDNSTDNSQQVINQYAEQYPQVKAFHNDTNIGVSEVRNLGAKVAQGEYLVFLDADDQIKPDWLKYCYTAMQQSKRIGIVYTPLELLLTTGEVRKANWPPTKPDIAKQLQTSNIIPTCCLIRKEAFTRAGGYTKRFEPTEDGELWTKILECGYDVKCASTKPLFTYRLGHNSLSKKDPKGPEFYLQWHRPNRQGSPPCAALGSPNKSWPVRDYDQPLFSIVIDHTAEGLPFEALQQTMDSLLGQTYQFWEAVINTKDPATLQGGLRGYPYFKKLNQKPKAPLVLQVLSGDYLKPNLLEQKLAKYLDTGEFNNGLQL